MSDSHKMAGLKSPEQKLSDRLSPKFLNSMSMSPSNAINFKKRVRDLHSSLSNATTVILLTHLKPSSRCSNKKQKMLDEKRFYQAVSDINEFKEGVIALITKKHSMNKH